MNIIGDYTIWYICTDPSGNKDSVSRLVQVRDITKPVINLLGINEVNLPRWKEYIDPPVAIEDNYNTDASLRGFLEITNSLPKNVEGYYFGDVLGLFSVCYTVRDSSGNVSDEVCRKINVIPNVGLGSLNIDDIMSVYPNPTSGKLYLRLVDRMDKDIKVTVMDLLGKSILTESLNGRVLQAQELDLSEQPNGIYLLKVEAGDKVYMNKIQVD
ncbi:MAG: T9SS type A sorting domain-containing protein [Bacteroidetes bacterium]|nr:T9SS type A sorting domain-containing protein [Bacteroidota bacterium]